MKSAVAALILGTLLLAGVLPARAQDAVSAWPALNYDAAQSNNNATEHTLDAHNVLKLKVLWTAPLPSVSYPIVADGHVYVPILTRNRVHVRALDIATGKPLMTYPKDALGGLLSLNGNLYLAGHILQEVDPTSGQKIGQVDPRPKLSGGTFLDPVADSKVLIAGYASTRINAPSVLYGVDPQANSVLWKLPSTSGNATLDGPQVITETAKGGAFFDEMTGKQLGKQPAVYSQWFAGAGQAYTVATVKRRNATLFAYGTSGHIIWHRVVGPNVIAQDWPHAVSPDAVYVATDKPQPGIEALDPQTGHVLWHRPLPNAERLVLANGLLYVLSFSLGLPVRLIMLRATTGKPVGAIVLSSGYYAFNEPNGLMVADGMVFIRAAGPSGPMLVALGL